MSITYGPSIATSGLVLNMDAAGTKSYPGSGTTWTDSSASRISMTLTNGPTYSANNLGYFSFNGSSTYATASNNTALDTQTPTVEVWIKTNATSQNGFWFEKGSVNTQYSLFQEGASIVWRQYMSSSASLVSQYTTTASYISTSNWAQIVGTYASGSRLTYINGVLVTSDTQSGTIATNTSGLYIGAYGTGTGYYYNGNLSVVRVYNRVLTAAEVLQNFNAVRGRYGI